MVSFPLVVCVLGEAAVNRGRTASYPHYIFEILAHAGVFHQAITPPELENALTHARVLITVGEGELTDAQQGKLTDWVTAGGRWLSIGATSGMEKLLGVERVSQTFNNWGGGIRSLGEGYLKAAEAEHPMLAHINRPLHFFGGAAVRARGARVLATAQDAHGRATDLPALLEISCGQGKCVLITVDLTGTVVHVQQGHGISRDGVPAPDGTSPVNDGVLKSDDGAVLDWIFDREPVVGAEGLSIFVQPIADLWKEVLLRGIFYLAGEAKAKLPVLWYWPRKLPAIGHLSHDTDGNDPKLAQRLLDTLAAGEVKSTWCVILPGYGDDIMKKIAAAGHEFATHYDAMTPGLDFCEAQFDRQFAELKKMFGHQPVTNKNHYLRWEGDCELWDWCAKHDIQLDQSKGASKTGEAGYNFGTCHPYFPVRFNGQSIDVLELPTPTQDLIVFAPTAILEPLLSQSLKHHGMLHLLFHPAHFHKDEVAAAMAHAIRRGKESKMEWWTARELNAWERARRSVRLEAFDGKSVSLGSNQAIQDATILFSSGVPASSGDRSTSAISSFTVWGAHFNAVTMDLSGTTRIEME